MHPGGPFFAKRDEGVWSLPKGLPEPDEPLLDAACREFAEETSLPVPAGDPIALGSVRQKGGKVVHAWALEGDCDPASLRSNPFELEWPPRSGRVQSFPEVDRGAWLDAATARRKLNPAQTAFLDRLEAALAGAEAG